MIRLLYKEWKLAVHPTNYIFLLLGSMLLIPSYPYYVAFFYQTLGIFFTFMNGNATNDLFFTTLLPVRKRDVVRARMYSVIMFQALQLIVAVPFAILRGKIVPSENLVGLDANVALFGVVLIMFGVFNVVFLPLFYRTGHKIGVPYLLATFAMMVVVVSIELIIQLTHALKQVLDTMTYAPQQLFVLVVGFLIFALLNAAAYHRSAAAFERLDL